MQRNSRTCTLLSLTIDIPDVSHHGVGTALQVPGSQGQLHTQTLHVGALSDGGQSVRASAQQEVTEGRLHGRLVGREEGGLNLGRQKSLTFTCLTLKEERGRILLTWRPTGLNSGSVTHV